MFWLQWLDTCLCSFFVRFHHLFGAQLLDVVDTALHLLRGSCFMQSKALNLTMTNAKRRHKNAYPPFIIAICEPPSITSSNVSFSSGKKNLSLCFYSLLLSVYASSMRHMGQSEDVQNMLVLVLCSY